MLNQKLIHGGRPLVVRAVLHAVNSKSQQQNSCTPEAYRLDFSVYRPGVELKVSLFKQNRPLDALNRPMAGFFRSI